VADVVLQLGDFVFSGFEIPENIGFGGEQQLAVHRFPGGAKNIDAMGYNPGAKQWSGIFLGQNASDRAADLQSMLEDGLPLELTWADQRFTVVMRQFLPIFDAPFRIPYSIVCEVLKDETFDSDTAAGLDGQITSDMTTASGLASTVGNGTLSSLMGTLSTAVGTVSSFAKAAQSTISSVLTPLNAVRSQVQTLIASTENTLKNVATVGGILPNNPLAKSVASLTTQINTHLTGTALYSLDGVLGRMAGNLGQVNSSVKTITVTGGNLFDLASKHYGDASGWTSIAKANNLSDPEITGINTLIIPQNNSDSSGVLTA